MKKLTLLAAIAALVFLVAACGGKKTSEQSAVDSSKATTSEEASASGSESQVSRGDTGAQDESAVDTTATPDQPVEFAGAHILIMYKGSRRADDSVTRTKEEAKALAQQLAERARKGEDFAELAKEYSDGPSGPRGGELGTWVKGRMIPEFDAAMESLKIGEVSDPVETPFGYHVILRKKVEKIYCRHILIMHEGSARKPPNVSRTREEAKKRAEEVLAKARAGENFEDLAREYSDGPTATVGGDLGGFGRGAMVPAFEQAAFALKVGEISDVVETPFGFHIIQRYK